MIRVQIDTNLPSVLQALADPALLDRLANVAAEGFNDDIHDWIDSGLAFTPRSRGGGLEQAINWRPAGAATAEVYAQKNYAGFVEYGTGPHVIEPRPGRKGLKIPVARGQGYIIRRKVNHPGSWPYPFMFADLENRKQRMTARVLSVLAAHAGAQ
jgi:hypothetical protein